MADPTLADPTVADPTLADPTVCDPAVRDVLELRGVSRAFGERVVFDGLDLVVGAGERVAAVGPNGAGKTTLLRVVAGTLAPSSGRVTVEGRPAGSLAARRSLGAQIAGESSLYPRLTGRQNLLLFARLREGRRAAAAAVAALGEELELGWLDDRRVAELSAGMRGQLSFARALLGDPALLVLDEPTRSMDAGARERLWQALDRRPRTAAVLASHLVEDLDRCARRVSL